MAHVIQKPDVKTKVCLVFKGLQGSGKSSIWNWFGNMIVGQNWFLNVYDAHYLLDNRFNSELKNKCVTLIDEAQTNGKYITGAERFKTRITELKTRIEEKGIESYILDDYNNYILLTNNDFPVNVESSDRRYFCVETSNELIKNKNYFTKYFEILKDQEVAVNFYKYLLNINLKDFNTEDIPETEFKTNVRIDSAPNPIRFAIDIISNGLTCKDDKKDLDYMLEGIKNGEDLDKVTLADTQQLYKCYKQYVIEKCPGERIFVYNGFKNKFKELLNIKTNKMEGNDITMINKKIIENGILNYFNVDDISEIIGDNIIYDEGYNSN
jgi:hypothetical protein